MNVDVGSRELKWEVKLELFQCIGEVQKYKVQK